MSAFSAETESMTSLTTVDAFYDEVMPNKM